MRRHATVLLRVLVEVLTMSASHIPCLKLAAPALALSICNCARHMLFFDFVTNLINWMINTPHICEYLGPLGHDEDDKQAGNQHTTEYLASEVDGTRFFRDAQ